jgi:TRAP-type C4-dicarboxylate transport system substrate-binding protein
MKDLTRRTALVAASVGAAALATSGAHAAAQDEEADKKLKQGIHLAAAVKIWRTTNKPTAQAAADFVNLPQAQVAGEVSITVKPNGTYDVFYFL